MPRTLIDSTIAKLMTSLGAQRPATRERSHFVDVDTTQVNRLIDHTLLKADATDAMVENLCAEAREHAFASVCVNPSFVTLASRALEGSNVMTCTVVGFPLGATTSAAKAFETKNAIENGADEIDMVLAIGALKSERYLDVWRDVAAVVDAAGSVPVKVIIESCLLSDTEKIIACWIAKDAGAAFVKTSTGFSTGGATAADIALMRTTVGPHMGVKASGGVRTRDDAIAMIKAGATRIGTSNGVAIVQGAVGSGY